MASSSRTSSGSSSQLPISGLEENLQAVMDQKKRKRMLSNRESARRSRMRKQKHLDDLMAQVSQLKKDNSQMMTTMNITTHHYLGVEAENSVLRTQMMELTSRLNSLNEILQYMTFMSGISGDAHQIISDSCINPWSSLCMIQPIIASSDMIHYC